MEGAPCPQDIDGNGTVGTGDLLAVRGPNPGHPADIDGNGTVGTADLPALLANCGPCAPDLDATGAALFFRRP